MAERPGAEFHARRVLVKMTPDKSFSVLKAINSAQTFSISLSLEGLEALQDRIHVALSARVRPVVVCPLQPEGE
jgi:hypothetical protein